MANIKADEISKILREQIENYEQTVSVDEVGAVISVGDGIARVYDLRKAINARDAVPDADDCADFIDRNGLLVILNLLAQNLADFVRFDIRHACSVPAP